ALRLHAHRERAIGLRAGYGSEPIGDFRLDQKDDARGQGRRERLVEQGGGDVVGDVAHHLEMRSAECGMRNARVSVDESMPVQLQGVPQHEAESANSELRTPHSALVCQLSIFFY